MSKEDDDRVGYGDEDPETRHRRLLAKDARAALEICEAAERERMQVRTRLEVSLSRSVATSASRAYEVMDRLTEILHLFDRPPHSQRFLLQIRLHDRMRSCLAPRIFGKDFAAERVNIMNRYGFNRIDRVNFYEIPRQFGKTTAVAMFMAAALVTVPNLRIGVISMTLAAARGEGLLGEIKAQLAYLMTLDEVQGYGLRVMKNSESLLRVELNKTDVRRVVAYAATKAIRGSTFCMIAVDEAAFIDDWVFVDLLFPIARRAHVGLIVFSSPAKDANLGKIFNVTMRRGGPKTWAIRLVCDPCFKLGIVGSCAHRKHEIPTHSTREGDAEIAELYGNKHQAAYDREIRGLAAEPPDPHMFNPIFVERFLKNAAHLPNDCLEVVISVDPAAGTARPETSISELAIVTTVAVRGCLILVGVDSMVFTRFEETESLIIQHVHAILSRPQLSRAKATVSVEQGTGNAHDLISGLIKRRFAQVEVFMSGGKDGFATNHGTKLLAIGELQKRLYEDALAVDPEMFTQHKDGQAVALEELGHQLLRFREYTTLAESPFARPKTEWHGKGENKKMMDDRAMALIINCGTRYLMVHRGLKAR